MNKDIKINGFRRDDGKFGIRNHILVLPTVSCAFRVAEMIKEKAPFLTLINNQIPCSQMGANRLLSYNTLSNIGKHPNVFGVILIGVGCEGITARSLAEDIKKSGKKTEVVDIEDDGGSIKASEKGVRIAGKFYEDAEKFKKKTGYLSELTFGVECGANDTFSAFSANPAVGEFVDEFVNISGTVIISETLELLHAKRTISLRIKDKVEKEKFNKIINNLKKIARKEKVDFDDPMPLRGNKRGGISTIAEKSFSGILKAGKSEIKEVINFGNVPSKKGLIIMDTPVNDVLSLTGMAAGGSQIILFTTGLGSPVGSPVAPVIKIASNTPLYKKLSDNIDLDAGTVIDGTNTLSDVKDNIIEFILGTAEGTETKSEILRHVEFGIPMTGTTY